MTPTCVRSTAANETGSGFAAIRTVAAHHGLHVSDTAIQAVTAATEIRPSKVLLDLLHVADLLGFDVRILEGDFKGLREVPLPGLLLLRTSATSDAARTDAPDARHVVVVFEASPDSVSIGDPATGEVKRWSQSELEARWTGDCVQMVPNQERLALAKQRAWKTGGPLRFLNLQRPYGPKAWYPVLAAAVGFLAFSSAIPSMWQPATMFGRVALGAIGVAFLAALWAWAFAREQCQVCEQAAWHAGELPVAALGTGMYFGIFLIGLLVTPYEPSLLSAAAGFAAGGQLYFLGVLAKHRVRCVPCLATGLSAVTAAVAIALELDLHALVLEAGAVACGLGVTTLLVPAHAKLAAFSRAVIAQQLATRVVSEPSDGSVRMIVWIPTDRFKCAGCGIYASDTRPQVEATYGDRVTIEERTCTDPKLRAPLIIVRGGVDIQVPTWEHPSVAAAIELALETAPLQSRLAGMLVIQGDDLASRGLPDAASTEGKGR